MVRICFFFFTALLLGSCGQSSKKETTGQEVLTDFIGSIVKKDFQHAYSLISPYCRQHFSEEQFKAHYLADSTTWTKFDSVIPVKGLGEKNLFYYAEARIFLTRPPSTEPLPSYRYFTAEKQSGKWQVIWTRNLQDSLMWYEYHRDWEKVKVLADSISGLDPYCGMAAYAQANYAYRSGDAGLTLDLAKRMAQYEPRNPNALRSAGFFHSVFQEYEHSIPYFHQALKYLHTNGQKLPVYAFLAMDYCANRNFDQAEIYNQKVLAEQPNDFRPLLLQCEIGIGLGDAEKGLENFPRVLSICKSKEEKAFVNAKIGVALLESAKTNESLVAMEKIRVTEMAKKYLQTAVDLSPENTFYKQKLEEREKFMALLYANLQKS